MGLELPGDVAWVLGILGFRWINLDEDRFRQAGSSFRTLGADLEAAKGRADPAARSIMQANKGQAVDAFAAAWEKLSHSHAKDLITACEMVADVLDGAAAAIEVAKGIVIAEVIAAAAAFAAATASAVFTLGLSELADMAVTQGFKEAIRIALEDLEHALVQQAKMIAEQEVLTVIEGVASNIIDQGLGNVLGVDHGFNAGAALNAGRRSAVAGAKGIGAAYTDPKFLLQDGAGLLASSAVSGMRGSFKTMTGGSSGDEPNPADATTGTHAAVGGDGSGP